MKARDIMTKEVITFAPETPILEIARAFQARGISGAPVVEKGRLIGIVTQSDLIARHARPHSPLYFPFFDAKIPLGGQHEYRELVRRILGNTAHDIMSTPVKTVDADADLEEVATLMVESRANPLPVMENGKMVGILSQSDLVRTLERFEEPGV
jgi:CBS domain-containing protein